MLQTRRQSIDVDDSVVTDGDSGGDVMGNWSVIHWSSIVAFTIDCCFNKATAKQK